MRLIKIPFIIAFALAASAIGLSYIACLRHESEPTNYLWYDALQELHELCRAKHRQSHTYNDYARYAEQDSLHSLASMFRALSYADNVQCENCRRAIESLGGRFQAPVVATTPQHNLHQHLNHALQTTQTLREGPTQRCLHRAIGDNNRYIARIITWCDASDIEQIMILQHYMASPQVLAESPPYRVCPTCGAISNHSLHTAYCPHCMTSGEKFLVFD